MKWGGRKGRAHIHRHTHTGTHTHTDTHALIQTHTHTHVLDFAAPKAGNSRFHFPGRLVS